MDSNALKRAYTAAPPNLRIFAPASERIPGWSPIPPAALPPKLFHATTRLSNILEDGVLLGDHHDEYSSTKEGYPDYGEAFGGSAISGVSFTTDKAVADHLGRSLRRAVEISNVSSLSATKKLFEQYFAEDKQLLKEQTKDLGAGAEDSWSRHRDRRVAIARDKLAELALYEKDHKWGNLHEDAFVTWKGYLEGRGAGTQPERSSPTEALSMLDPVILTERDSFLGVDVSQVGVLEVDSRAIPKDALTRVGDDDFSLEVRVHADVPLLDQLFQVVPSAKLVEEATQALARISKPNTDSIASFRPPPKKAPKLPTDKPPTTSSKEDPSKKGSSKEDPVKKGKGDKKWKTSKKGKQYYTTPAGNKVYRK